jgi:hypothetical protein
VGFVGSINLNQEQHSMITTSKNLETIPAWEHVAGSSLGTWSEVEITEALIKAVESIRSDSSVHELREDWEKLNYFLNGRQDHDAIYDFQVDAVDLINSHGTVEDYCTLDVQDGEWMVRPYIDDELPRFDDYQDDYQGDHVLIVNDHGNATCQRWNGKAYVTIWDMV